MTTNGHEVGTPPRQIFHAGQAVRITYRGKTVDGWIVLASANNRSLALGFDAMLGGWVGKMPVLMDEGHFVYRDLIEGQLVGIEIVLPGDTK